MNPAPSQTCPDCGAALHPQARFCHACGKPVPLAAGSPVPPRAASPVKVPNPERIGVFVGVGVLVVAAILFLLPWATAMDMMNGGYALQFIGFFLLISGGVVLFFWQRRAALFDQIMAGRNVLAHWRYSPSQSQEHARRELQERSAYNRAIYATMLFFAVICGCIFFVIPAWQGEMPAAAILAWFGFFAFLGLVAWGAPQLSYRRALKSSPQAYISQDGLYINGALHAWRQPLTRLVGVAYHPDTSPPELEFKLSYLTRVGVVTTQIETVHVPVPAGEEETAREIVKFFENRSAGEA